MLTPYILNKEQSIYVEEDIRVKANEKVIDTENILSDWNTKMINADDIASVQANDKIKIAVIDSGIDLDVNVKKRYNLVPTEENVSPLYDDLTGHGTGVAGIIASNGSNVNVKGINSDVEIYSIKVFDGDNSAPLSRIIEAIYKAIECDVDIINMSLGTVEYSEILHQAIKEAYDKNILIVAAAGNGGEGDNKIEYPAAYDEVLSVGSVDATANISEYSSGGNQADIFAPGELVRTMAGFGDEIAMSGTSVAVPHVVGAASIIWQKDKTKSVDFIKGLLIESANKSNRNYSLLDLEHALNVYEQYEKNYKDEVYNILGNNNIVEVCDNPVIMEGSWYEDNHASLIKSVAGYTEEKYDLLRIGIRIPDVCLSDRNMWHALTEQTNYVAGTYFVSKIIKTAALNGTGVTCPNGITAIQYNDMIADITTRIVTAKGTGEKGTIWQIIPIKYKSILSKYNITSLTADRKRFVLWGMAMHIATDAFAHRAFRKVNGVWTHIDSPDTDKTYVAAIRYAAAAQVVKNIMIECIKSNLPIQSNCFSSKQIALIDTTKAHYDGTFKLKELYFFAGANRDDEPNFNSYALYLGRGTQPATTEQMGILMSLGYYVQ